MKTLVGCALYEGSSEFLHDYCLMLERNRKHAEFDCFFSANYAVPDHFGCKKNHTILEKYNMPYYPTLFSPEHSSSRERIAISYATIETHFLGYDYDYLIFVESDVRFDDHGVAILIEKLGKYPVILGFHPYDFYTTSEFDEKTGIVQRYWFAPEMIDKEGNDFKVAASGWQCFGRRREVVERFRPRWWYENRNHSDAFWYHDYKGPVMVTKEVPYLHLRKPWRTKPVKL